MAQLKDTIVSGNLRVTDTTLTDTLQVTTIKAPTSSGGSTYGPGTSGQVLKSNGTMTYWADMPTIPTVNNASLTLKGAGTTVTTFTANASTNQSLDIVAGTNVTITPDATNHKITIASSYTNTDTKVTQSQTTTTNYRPILFGAKNSTDISTLADTVTDQAYTSTKMFAKPDAGKIYASEFLTSSYINGTGSDLTQYGLYLRSYKTEALPAGGNYDYSRYAIRTYDGKSGDNTGMVLTMDGGGLTIVGSGESAVALATLISDDQRDSNTSRTRLDVGGTLNTSFQGSSEQLILSSDNSIYFLTNCNTITGRKPVCLDTSSYFYPGTNKTGSIGTSSYMWNSVYAATIYENGTSLASKYSAIGHTHETTIAADSGTNQLTLAASTKYKLTAGETNFIFTTPPNTTYSAGTGLSLSGTTFNHSNSVTAVTSAVFKKITYDAQGHITGTANVTASDLPSHTHSNYLGAVKIGSYYGMANPDGTDTSWTRTSRNGIIPYAINTDATNGNTSSLGTSTWTFVNGYINNIYYKDLKTITVVAGSTADNAIDKMAGSYFFSGTNLFGGVNDWVGIQAGYGSDKFQITANGASGVLYRHNDTGGTDTANWTEVRNLMTPEAVSGQDGIAVTKRTNTLGTGSTALTYDSGVIIGHSNSVTAVTNYNKPYVKYDAQGHITGSSYWSATAAGTGGESGWVKVATIVHTDNYDNTPIMLLVSQRGNTITYKLHIVWKNVGNTDPDLDVFRLSSDISTSANAYIKKSTTSTWELYIKKLDNYEAIAMHLYVGKYFTDHMTWTWQDVQTAASAITGGTEVTKFVPFNSYQSRTANTVLAAPNGSDGAASFRKLVAADIPSLNYIPMSGSTGVTGNIKITKASGDTGFYAKRSDTDVEVWMGVGAGGTNHGIYSNKLGKWMMYGDATNVYLNGNATTATTATKVATTVTNGTENTARYGIAFVADPGTSNAQAVLKNNDFRFNMKNGTDATGNTGNAEIVLGNSTPSGTAGNKKGVLTLYSTGSYYGNLDTGTLTANRTHTLPDASGTIKLEKRSMIYDDTQDWSSYSWHKFAEITSTTTYDDKAITFLVSRTYDTDYAGILSVHVRIDASKNYQKHQFKWLVADEFINPNNFVLVYTNNGTTSCKIELWYKQSVRYEGWIFEVLKEHTRMASENAWTVYTTSGHGSATYTAGTGHFASELACVQSKTALYAVKGTHTTTTNAWTGKIDANMLYDGMTIAYYLPYAVSPSASVTLNLTLSNGTTTGAINCYQNNTTRITTHYGAGSTIILTYWSAGSISVAGTATTDNRWTRCDYNSNSNVTQTNTTTSASYRVIFSGNANDTSETTTVRKSTNLQFNPSTAALSIGKAGTTQGSLVFNNSEGGHATLKSNSKGTSPTFLLPDTDDNLTHTLSTGMYDLSVTKGLMTISNVPNIPVHTMTFKIVFKSDGSTPIYSMIEIPNIDDGLDYGGLIQVGSYSDGQGSTRIIMKAVIVKITAGSTAGTKTFTATASPTQQVYGSSVSQYTRNVSIEKIYACT